MRVSQATIERLSAIRRYLREQAREGRERVFSHDLAACWSGSAAQVRRDLMQIGFHGSSNRGYEIAGLCARLDEVLGAPAGQRAALVGVGQIGRALLSYFVARNPSVKVAAAFDVQPDLVGRVIHGCPCHHLDRLEAVLRAAPAHVGIVATPSEAAQTVTSRLVGVGVRGIVNFAPVGLTVPHGVFVERIDIAVLLEKAAYFAQRVEPREEAV